MCKLCIWHKGSPLPYIPCSLHHCCSSSGKSLLMAKGDLYCHDHQPMAASVDQSNLIWLDVILKEEPDGSHQRQPVLCKALIHFLFPEGRSLDSKGWSCNTDLEQIDYVFCLKSIYLNGQLADAQNGCWRMFYFVTEISGNELNRDDMLLEDVNKMSASFSGSGVEFPTFLWKMKQWQHY